MEVKERTGYYDLVKYKQIILDDEEFMVDEEIGVVYRVIPDINHGCSEEIEVKTNHYDISEVFGIAEKLTINQFKEMKGVIYE